MDKILKYLQNNKMFMHKYAKIHLFYTSNQIIIELKENKNYYNKFIERTKNTFKNIKDMYYVKNDGSCHDEIKIILENGDGKNV